MLDNNLLQIKDYNLLTREFYRSFMNGIEFFRNKETGYIFIGVENRSEIIV